MSRLILTHSCFFVSAETYCCRKEGSDGGDAIAVLVAVSYYGYKGILWLSDWMNEVEEQRQKSRRYPRI